MPLLMADRPDKFELVAQSKITTFGLILNAGQLLMLEMQPT